MSRLISAFCLCLSSLLVAQQSSLVGNLKELSKKDGNSFSYDAELLKEVTLNRRFQSASDLSDFLIESTALQMEALSDKEFLIIPKRSQVSFSFSNAEDTQTLQEFYVDVIRGENEVVFQDFISDPGTPITFNWVPKPYDTLKVISTAYDPVMIAGNDLLVNLNLGIQLKEKVTYLEEVVIENYLAKGISINLVNQTTSIEMSDLALIPGETDGDVLAALATLPGVNTPDSRPGNLFIRGSSPDQNLLLYNHIPIYHRGHFFGTISPFNAAVVSDIELYKNGLDPNVGGRIGGAIVINSFDDLTDFKGFGVGLNSLYGTAFLKKKIGTKVGISLAGRRSLPSSFQPPKLINISDMVYAATALTGPNNSFDLDDVDVKYEDYNLNFLIAPNENNKIRLSGLLTSNATEYSLLQDTTRDSERVVYENQGLSLDWRTNFSNRTRGTLVAFYSDYGNEYERQEEDTRNRRLNFDIGQSNDISEYSFTYEVNHRLNESDELTLGLAAQNAVAKYEYRDIPNDNPPLRLEGEEKASTYSGFLNYDYGGFGRFYFQAGSRADYYTNTGKTYLSPRLLLNYDLHKDLILKASASRHYQFLNQIKLLQFGNSGFDNELWRLAGDEGIRPIYSDQLMFGGVITKGAVVFDIETYRKIVNNVNYASTVDLSQNTTYEPADWEITGFDIFSKVQVSNGLSIWGSYEYSEHTLAYDADEATSYHYKYNRPHRFKLGGLFQRGRWKYSFSWKVLSGMSGRSLEAINEFGNLGDDFMPGDGPPDGGPPDGGPPDGGPPGGGMGGQRLDILTVEDLPERYPTFKSFDLFVTYSLPRTNARKWKANFGLSLINVFDHQNLIDQVVRGGGPSSRQLVDRYGLGFSPNLNITITW